MNSPTGITAERTDLHNAERFVAMFGHDLRWVGPWAKGLAWDGTRFEIDEVGHWPHAAAETARAMFEEAVVALRSAMARDDADRIKIAKADMAWAAKSQSSSRLAAMVQVARTMPSITVAHERLDADPMLLNVANGTIELRSGELRPHRRDDLLTKRAPVVFDPHATAPTWDAFLLRAMGGSSELVAFLQRLIGYALTGDVSEHVVAFFWGPGANGKSTFDATLHAMLGDYATPAPRGLIFRSRGERHPTELASLHGRRFVTCSEIEEGQAFDEALTKDLTGGDPIECRRMREDFWSYRPTHKLFLAGNHKPTVRGDDEGIWRRIRLIPWIVTIPEAERDRALPEKLRAELPGILAWAVRGCLEWQARGLDAPDAVRKATATYREENDTLGEFLRLTVTFDAAATVARKELREAYEAFCTENGAEPLGARRFAARLREHQVGETSVRVGAKVVNGWRGVRLATDAERAASVAWRCRYVGTCSDEIGYQHQTHAHDRANRDPGTTSTYVPTSEPGPFQRDLSELGIEGAE